MDGIAGRLRALRGERRQEEIAAAARSLGLRWDGPTVAALEAGTRRLSPEEVFLAPVVLQLATERDVTLEDLLPDEDVDVEIGSATVKAELLRAVARGEPAKALPGDVDTLRVTVPLEAERKAAAKLGVPAETIARAARQRWGRSLSAERDRRVRDQAPEGASRRSLQALRGHVTRELLAVLAPDLKEER